MDRLTSMRGDERIQGGMFSYVSLEQRVPQGHPLRAVRELTDKVLRRLDAEFDALYAVDRAGVHSSCPVVAGDRPRYS